MKAFEFVCGGAGTGKAADARRFVLDVQGKAKNIDLRITDISRAMALDLPDLLLDLLEVAAYVYIADQHAARGTDKLAEAGSNWRRNMRFTIPVRLPEVWTRHDVQDALVETLSFLSDDVYEFRFVAGAEAFAPPATYFPEFADVRATWTRLPCSRAGSIPSPAPSMQSLARARGPSSSDTIPLRRCTPSRKTSSGTSNAPAAPVECSTCPSR
jgi:hypothetical protein